MSNIHPSSTGLDLERDAFMRRGASTGIEHRQQLNELLHIVDALQLPDSHHVAMPDKWKDGEDAMISLNHFNQLDLRERPQSRKTPQLGAERPRLPLTSKAYKYVLRNQ
jgi:hypothetical protein